MKTMPRKTNTTINNNDYFRVRATVGKNPDGTLIRKAFYGASKKEAEQKRDEFLQGIKKGLGANYDKLTFGAVFNEWFKVVHTPTLALSSAKRYETDIKLRILPSSLMVMTLAEIKSMDIQKFYNGLTASGTSADSVRNTNKLLSAFFKYCVNEDYIVKSPLRSVTLPEDRKIQSENSYLTNADIAKVVADARTNNDSFIFTFLIFSGLRVGEAMALTHADIDFEEGIINVNKSVGHLTIEGSYQPIVSPTKTKGSTREIPLFKDIRHLLKNHIREEKLKHFRLCVPFSENSILFSSLTGGYLEGRNLRRRWERLCKRLDIEKTTVHALRHTFCSILAERGVNLKTASELMGHSDIKVTQRVYVHVQKDEKIRAIASLSSAFPKNTKGLF